MADTYHPHTSILAAALRDQPVQLGALNTDNIRKLLDTASYHGVSALIDQKINNQQILGMAHTEKTRLSSFSKITAANDLLLNAFTRKTLDLLGEKQIPGLLLKGTAIACNYFDDSYLRTRCDTDLLIRESDKQDVVNLLSANHYRVSGVDNRKYASKQFSAILGTTPGMAAAFDIHWKLSNRTLFNNILQFDECWDARQPVKQLGKNAFTLSPVHLLIHACIHRIAHGRNSDRNRLIWLYDIHLITSAFCDEEFDTFLEMAITKGIGALCADGLVMSQYYFGTRYPGGYLTELSSKKSEEKTAPLINAAKLRWALADIQALKGAGAKAGLISDLLFPKRAGTTADL